MHPKITIIIPFFQQTKGLLRACVESALCQRGIENYEVIVVNDGSPISPHDELEDLIPSHVGNLRVVEQENRGPGAARNAGLDRCSDDTEYVAFLDSDDEWMKCHLANALFALQLGYDFYFSDFYFPEFKGKTAFERAGKIPLTQHNCISVERELYEYRGEMLDQILVTGNVIGTSNVVYRFAKYRQLRFREEFFNGQDYLFWLDFSRLGGSFVFSAKKECNCGTGINIYSGATWGTERLLGRLRNELRVWKFVEKEFQLRGDRRRANRARIQKIQESIVRDLLHRIVKRERIKVDLLIDLMRLDPMLPFLAAPISLKIIRDRFRRY